MSCVWHHFLVEGAIPPAQSKQYSTVHSSLRPDAAIVDFIIIAVILNLRRGVMTEEPSNLGFPDSGSYVNHNDDQASFSLLFKRYGFRYLVRVLYERGLMFIAVLDYENQHANRHLVVSAKHSLHDLRGGTKVARLDPSTLRRKRELPPPQDSLHPTYLHPTYLVPCTKTHGLLFCATFSLY